MNESKPVDLESVKTQINRKGDYVIDYVPALCDEVESLRERLKELEGHVVVSIIEAYTKGWFEATIGQCCDAVKYLDSIGLVKETKGDSHEH